MNILVGSIVMQKSGILLSVELQAENMLVNLLFPGFRTGQSYRRLCMTERWIVIFLSNGLKSV